MISVRQVGSKSAQFRHLAPSSLPPMRSVELAVYADALAGEAANLSARAERARSRLRQAAIERRAQKELGPAEVARLQARGLLGTIDERAVRAELREAEEALEALEHLQAWVEAQLEEATNVA
jgi:hypothetical protein